MQLFGKFFLALLLIGLCAACTTTGTTAGSTDASAGAHEAQYEEPDYYYDFDDILIPKEISYVQEDSYKLDNTKFRAAIMKFKGRVEVLELVQYFLNNMAKDNWTLISNNKAGKLSVMNFEKFNKSCVIQVDDSFGSATTTIIAVEVKDAGVEKSK
ncbi:putative lipoprotein [Pseudodesulfovibrio piezophilus C1TLV30]|uniref:Putative lipoprotein n=2 Tax=Pseudodesulfovibrio TaxID=2035811 RepID=M1WX13_PSEP2|nr:putative lipoprotein [Pseudodesulfovibrio piezophilus C1TLV30]